jgi:hypothetical protein
MLKELIFSNGRKSVAAAHHSCARLLCFGTLVVEAVLALIQYALITFLK